jgi:hypothetical protein
VQNALPAGVAMEHGALGDTLKPHEKPLGGPVRLQPSIEQGHKPHSEVINNFQKVRISVYKVMDHRIISWSLITGIPEKASPRRHKEQGEEKTRGFEEFSSVKLYGFLSVLRVSVVFQWRDY